MSRMDYKRIDFYLIALLLGLLALINVLIGSNKRLERIGDSLEGKIYINYETTETDN